MFWKMSAFIKEMNIELDVPESTENVPGPAEIEVDGTLLHPTSGPALVEGVKCNQLKYS